MFSEITISHTYICIARFTVIINTGRYLKETTLKIKEQFLILHQSIILEKILIEKKKYKTK